MDLHKIRDNLGRVKIYYLRGDSLRALGAAVAALKALGKAQVPTDVRSLLREGVQYLAHDETVKSYLSAPLIYQPGQESALFVLLARVFKRMEEDAGIEEHDAALARKRQMDQSLILGQKLLAQGKTSEADASFQQAVGFYRNEHRLFQLIGKLLLDAGQPRRAVSYLKRAVEAEPDNSVARELYNTALGNRESAPET
jgi:tetratricopeptide (TPR) repeat protein